MELAWSDADAAFRDEVRAFLDEKLTPDLRRAGRLATSVYSDHEASMEWQRILHERGWAAPAGPVFRTPLLPLAVASLALPANFHWATRLAADTS